MNKITPEIYKDLEILPCNLTGWNGDKPIFKRIIELVKPKNIIEVGTWRGQSAITMAKIIKDLNLPTKITCVDTWLGSVDFWEEKYIGDTAKDLQLKNGYPQVYYQFLSNVVHHKCEDTILPFPNTSYIAALYFQRSKITADLIYIDASHEYKDVLQDITEYWKILTPNGIMFGDDWPWGGVAQAVTEFATANNLKIVREDVFWILKKVK